MIKTVIGLVLLVVGAWVSWAGYQESETLTLMLGIASILGGLAFLLTRNRGHRVERRH